MQISNLVTAVVGLAAAFQGMRAAPVQPDPPGVFQIREICNGPALQQRATSRVPEALRALHDGEFNACMQGIEENPRIFRGASQIGQEALCASRAGVTSALKHATSDMRSEMPLNRKRIYGQIEIYEDPLPALRTAGHSLHYLRQINLHDYMHSGSTGYARQLDSQVELLKAYVRPEHRDSVRNARIQVESPQCRAAWSARMPIWARAEIAERIELVNMRLVGNPESISRDQARQLRDTLADMRLDYAALARRMRSDAVEALVSRSRGGSS